MDLSKHLEKAEDAAKRRNYALAVKIYGQLLGLQPDFGPARAGLHRVRFKKAGAKPPSKVFALLGGGIHLLTAKLCGTLKKPAAAARSYERYLAHDPLSESQNLALGRALESAGFSSAALAVYRSFAEPEPRCLLMKLTSSLTRSPSEFMALGLPLETIRPCTRRTRFMTTTGSPARCCRT